MIWKFADSDQFHMQQSLFTVLDESLCTYVHAVITNTIPVQGY